MESDSEQGMVGKSDKEPTPTVRQPFDYPITQTVPELILPNSPAVLFRAKLPPKYKVLVTIYNCTRVQSLTSNFVFYILIGQLARELEPNSHTRTCYHSGLQGKESDVRSCWDQGAAA